MTDLNIPAIASAAFLGFLALAALLFCIPPVTRFLGDLFCCPWRIPFTRKRRRNDDEELDKDDLPYLAKRRPSSTVDDTGYRSMPDAYMSAVRTRDYEDVEDTFGDHPSQRNYSNDRQGPEEDYYSGSYDDHHAQLQQPDASHNRDWWRSPTEEYPEYHDYPSRAAHGYDPDFYYSDEDIDDYGTKDFLDHDIQRPQPSYSPQEMNSYQHAGGYFPGVDHDYYSQYRRI